MNAQNLILASRATHIRELKTEIAKIKSENDALRAENASLLAHFDLALLAAEDLRTLAADGKLIILDGWNLILSATREATSPADLIAHAKEHLAKNASDKIWIVFDGPRENSFNEDRLRISYTGGTGAHRADRLICDFMRMARYRGDFSRIEVRTHDKDFKKMIARLTKAT